MTEEKLATLADARRLKGLEWSIFNEVGQIENVTPKVRALCTTVERLAAALKAIVGEGCVMDDVVTAQDLLAQLGATP